MPHASMAAASRRCEGGSDQRKDRERRRPRCSPARDGYRLGPRRRPWQIRRSAEQHHRGSSGWSSAHDLARRGQAAARIKISSSCSQSLEYLRKLQVCDLSGIPDSNRRPSAWEEPASSPRTLSAGRREQASRRNAARDRVSACGRRAVEDRDRGAATAGRIADRRRDDEHGHPAARSAMTRARGQTTVIRRVPTPSMPPSSASPRRTEPTPAGVPV